MLQKITLAIGTKMTADEIADRLAGWSDGQDHDELYAQCHFDDTGYLGPDADGLEPVFLAADIITISDLVAEFARVDAAGAEGYRAHAEGGTHDWPTVGFQAGGGGHAVVSVHPDDVAAAVLVMRRYRDGQANETGPESLLYDPVNAMRQAGIRCEWHV